ncbi:MAG: hypothetical protein ABIJ46_00930 [bacterium]
MQSQAPKILLSVALTAVIVGGGVFFWQQGAFNQSETEPADSQPVTCQEAEELTEQVVALQEDNLALSDQLTGERLRSAVLSRFDGETFVWPKGDVAGWVGGFAYTSREGGQDMFRVGRYDAAEDVGLAEGGRVMLSPGETFDYIYEEALADGQRIEVVGLDLDRLILWETGADNSPGPCFSPWSAEGLTYIGLNDLTPVRSDYLVSNTKLEEVRAESERCLREL